MSILNIAGYKFIDLNELPILRASFTEACTSLSLKGTILLSQEGININLAGSVGAVQAFRTQLKTDPRFANMSFHETYSETQPFRYLKIKLKNEIITLRQSDIQPHETRAPSISPETFKQWLDEKRPLTILDTRNDYEVRFGTFTGALNLHMENFGDFPAATKTVQDDKPIVMFCTGGIRCEKAALYLLNQGYSNVYQLEGGILNYFAKVGGSHYEGECFVFDERIAVNPMLKTTDSLQCNVCQGPVTKEAQELPAFKANQSCPACNQCRN